MNNKGKRPINMVQLESHKTVKVGGLEQGFAKSIGPFDTNVDIDDATDLLAEIDRVNSSSHSSRDGPPSDQA